MNSEIQELEGTVVEPLVMSRSVHIDPLVVIVAVLIGINLLGIIGAVLATATPGHDQDWAAALTHLYLAEAVPGGE